MINLQATPIINEKFWIVKQNGNRIGLLRKTENQFIFNQGQLVETFKTKKTLTDFFGKDFFSTSLIKTPSDLSTNEVHGYPTNYPPYNSVFDVKNRKLVGDFETMYQNESKENFDSWHQDDTRQLQRKIDLSILEDYNFSKIIDIGCGKGSLSHLLKKKNNYVLGLDISQTAVNIAQERFPDIDLGKSINDRLTRATKN